MPASRSGGTADQVGQLPWILRLVVRALLQLVAVEASKERASPSKKQKAYSDRGGNQEGIEEQGEVICGKRSRWGREPEHGADEESENSHHSALSEHRHERLSSAVERLELGGPECWVVGLQTKMIAASGQPRPVESRGLEPFQERAMRFYTESHQHYCGIDLHARTMYLCILDHEGQVLLHEDVKSRPEAFLEAVAPYREGLVVAVECIFTWYWLADLFRKEGIAFVLGHALYMKAIHGAKAKNDKVDALKIARLLKGGNLPQAYVYPPEMRATRDLLRIPRHRPLPARPGLPLLRSAGEVRAQLRGQEAGEWRRQDRQRPPEVGLLGSRDPVLAQQPARPGLRPPSGGQARKTQGALDPGGQAGEGGLSHAPQRAELRRGALPRHELNDSKERGWESPPSNWSHAGLSQRSGHDPHGHRPAARRLDWTPTSPPIDMRGAPRVALPRALPLSRARSQLALRARLTLNGRAREPTSFSDTEQRSDHDPR